MDWIGGTLDRIRETQLQHTSELREIKALLKQRRSVPLQRRAPRIEWNKHLPRICLTALVLGLAAANYRLPDILQILSRLP